MDDNDFMKAFMNVDLLRVEGIAKTIGAVIAKLREGMVQGGMPDYAADSLIASCFRMLLDTMVSNFDPKENK